MASINLHHLATATTRFLQCKVCLELAQVRALPYWSHLLCSCFECREAYWAYPGYPQGNRYKEGS